MTLTPDPAHDTTGNGTESHYDLARQLEMRGYEIRADRDDIEHSEVYFEGRHVGDIRGDSEATVTTVATLNPMTNHMIGSNGAHMSPTWDDVWNECEESDAVSEYSQDDKTVTWCDGSESTFIDPQQALNEIYAMNAN